MRAELLQSRLNLRESMPDDLCQVFVAGVASHHFVQPKPREGRKAMDTPAGPVEAFNL